MLIGAKMLLPATGHTSNCSLHFAKKGAADQQVNTELYIIFMISAHEYHSTPQSFWLTCLKCGIVKQFQNVKKDTNWF